VVFAGERFLAGEFAVCRGGRHAVLPVDIGSHQVHALGVSGGPRFCQRSCAKGVISDGDDMV